MTRVGQVAQGNYILVDTDSEQGCEVISVADLPFSYTPEDVGAVCQGAIIGDISPVIPGWAARIVTDDEPGYWLGLLASYDAAVRWLEGRYDVTVP